MADDTAGDPVTGVKWCRRTTEKIADELREHGIDVCANTVASLLRQLGFRLRVNQKKVARPSKPEREEQFVYIATQRKKFTTAALPIVSVDTKHRELIGNFARAGSTWRQTPYLVNDHDFPSDAQGVAIPYGVYDLHHNRGCVSVGTSRDTPQFAVASLTRWWTHDGRHLWPGANQLLVLADGGGSNAYRSRGFKHALQHFANRYRITITVCHYPTSASKWNPIEHRLFSEISKNWAGEPLTSYEVALKYIATTTTTTGLTVKAYLDERDYPKVTITDQQMDAIELQPHTTQPSRNYTISPQCT
jgi:Rhodopirellula transposase DDE domain